MRTGKTTTFLAATLAVALSAGFAALSPAVASTKHVDVLNGSFDPKTVRLRVGDSVHWTKSVSNDQHNVEHALFSSGTPTTESFDFSRTFSAGRFKYFCEIHRFSGMKGTVNVPVLVSAAPTGTAFSVTWATSATNTGTKFDVQYKVGTGSWKTWKSNTTAAKAVFGRSGAPVNVVTGRSYSFRARSKSSAGASSWSPVKRFKA